MFTMTALPFDEDPQRTFPLHHAPSLSSLARGELEATTSQRFLVASMCELKLFDEIGEIGQVES